MNMSCHPAIVPGAVGFVESCSLLWRVQSSEFILAKTQEANRLGQPYSVACDIPSSDTYLLTATS